MNGNSDYFRHNSNQLMNSSGTLPQYNKEEPLQIEDEDSVNYQDHHASKDLIRHCNYYGIARKSSIK